MRSVVRFLDSIQHAERAFLGDDLCRGIEQVDGGDSPQTASFTRSRTMVKASLPKQFTHRIYVGHDAGVAIADEHLEGEGALDAVKVDVLPCEGFLVPVRHVQALLDVMIESYAVLIVQVEDRHLSLISVKKGKGAVRTEGVEIDPSLQFVGATAETGKGIERMAGTVAAAGLARRFAQSAHARWRRPHIEGDAVGEVISEGGNQQTAVRADRTKEGLQQVIRIDAMAESSVAAVDAVHSAVQHDQVAALNAAVLPFACELVDSFHSSFSIKRDVTMKSSPDLNVFESVSP